MVDTVKEPRRLTHVEVGRTLGLTTSAVSRMRSGERATSIPTIRAISKAYDVPLEMLVDAWIDLYEGRPETWVGLLEDTWGPRF